MKPAPDPDGWKIDYPYREKMSRSQYETKLCRLHVELVKATRWVADTGQRVAVFVDGPETAGKTGLIRCLTQHADPRIVRTVRSQIPVNDGRWFFTHWLAEMPRHGETVFFDRSWWTRPLAEHPGGWCTDRDVEVFYRQAPVVENMLRDEQIILIKLFLTIPRRVAVNRLYERSIDPLKRWKLSDADLYLVEKWDAVEFAQQRTLQPKNGPWFTILGHDKNRARIEAAKVVLHTIPYTSRRVPKLDDKITCLIPRSDECR